jgi:hypothetical protein
MSIKFDNIEFDVAKSDVEPWEVELLIRDTEEHTADIYFFTNAEYKKLVKFLQSKVPNED